MGKARVFYVEDDAALAFVTRDNLGKRGFEVFHFSRGQTALQGFDLQDYDLCILDIMLPDMDGFALAREIRKKNQDIPILFLTARTMQEDKMKGFLEGGDDYITKPFSVDELVMRMEVFLRRKQIQRIAAENGERKIGKFRLDPGSRILQSKHSHIKLTHRESDLLCYLQEHANHRLKRESILQAVWGQDDYFSGRSLDVFISRLRKYLQDDPQVILETIHGFGFCLHTPAHPKNLD
jgi:DNA-binding response OmpR family regulator